jgi:rRNA-processing protein FCF1
MLKLIILENKVIVCTCDENLKKLLYKLRFLPFLFWQ